MTPETIIQIFRREVSQEINLIKEGTNRYIVFTPFMFDDGDHLVIILKQENGKWYLTDEGHTFMHISYDEIDIKKGTRAKIIDTVLEFYRIKNVEGELQIDIENDSYDDSLWNFIHGLLYLANFQVLKSNKNEKENR